MLWLASQRSLYQMEVCKSDPALADIDRALAAPGGIALALKAQPLDYQPWPI